MTSTQIEGKPFSRITSDYALQRIATLNADNDKLETLENPEVGTLIKRNKNIILLYKQVIATLKRA